jgi:hypothetical protein
MYSIVLLVVGAAALAVTLWTLRQWQLTRSAIILFVLLPLAATPYEVLVAGLGRFIGPGDRLRDLAGLPILWWSLTLPLALFSFATICRRLGFWWARIDWGHGIVCIGAVVLMLWELPRVFGTKRIWPACWQDVVHYTPVVPAGQLCPGAAVPGESPAAVWLTQWIVLGAFAGLGAGLATGRRWPWLAVGAFPALLLLLLPAEVVGPVPAYVGRALGLAAMALAAVRYADLPPLETPDRPAAGAGT